MNDQVMPPGESRPHAQDGRPLIAAMLPPPARHPATVYLARLAPGSRRTMRGALTTIAALLTDGCADAETLDWGALRYPHTAAARAALSARYAPATANKALAALRGVLREAWRLGYTDAEAYRHAADLPPVRGSSRLQGRALTAGELRALFATCAAAPGAAAARDAALLAVLYGGGLRRGEVVALDLADYDDSSGALRVQQGKGRKPRTAYLTGAGAAALTAWLHSRGTAAGPLFLRVRRGGHMDPHMRRMTDQSVYDIVRRRAAQAGVPRFSPHDVRRTFISDLLDAGADLAAVQRLAGHADSAATARYDRRGAAAERRAATLLHVPYVAPAFPAPRDSGQSPPLGG